MRIRKHSHSWEGIIHVACLLKIIPYYLIVVYEEWELLLGEKSGLANIHAIFSIEKLDH